MARSQKTATSSVRQIAGATQGAGYRAAYTDRKIPVVSVSIDELEDFKSASKDEFAQFAIAQFMAAGAFWLGIERLVTIPEFWTDLLFWICVVCLIAGCCVGYFGFQQMRRRQTRIERIITSAQIRAAGITSHTP